MMLKTRKPDRGKVIKLDRRRIPDGPSGPAQLSLRILATTDLHMHILPYDYLSDREVERWGLSRTAGLIHQARIEAKNSILLDNGDFLYGTAMADLVTAAGHTDTALPDFDIHPMIAAMTHLRYDAATLGNHDFDHGVSSLFDVISQADFPVVSANAVDRLAFDPRQDATFVPPYVILNREVEDADGHLHELRIGVIGFLPPGSIKTTGEPHQPVTRDIVQAARVHVPEMRRKGAHIVVALAHSGIGDEEHVDNMENALLPLSRIDGIDAIIGGHTHQVFPDPQKSSGGDATRQTLRDEVTGTLNGVPTALPGFWGSHLAVIDLELAQEPLGDWRVLRHSSGLRSVDALDNEEANQISPNEGAPMSRGSKRPHGDSQASDRAAPAHKDIRESSGGFVDLVRRLHESTVAHLRTPVGFLTNDIDNYFALFGADCATKLVQKAMVAKVRDLVAGTELDALPILASSAPFKSGGLGGPNYFTAIRAGELTRRAISDLYLFPNELALVKVTGAELRNWLERAVSVFNQVLPGERGVLLKEDATPGYLYETVYGLSYRVDLSQPARFTALGAPAGLGAGRVLDLCYNGQPLEDGQVFLLATNDFRVSGGGGYPAFSPTAQVPVPMMPIREVLEEYVRQATVLARDLQPIWSFAPVEGASVLLKSSPKARETLERYPALDISVWSELDHRGFAHYELHL